MQNTFNWKWISLLFAGRFLTSSAFFMYVGTLPFLLQEWNLSGTQAGAIQTAAIVGLHCRYLLHRMLVIFLTQVEF